MRSSLRQVLFRSTAGLDLNFAGGVFSLNNTRTASPAAIPGWSFSRTDTNGTATALDLAGNVIQFPSRTNVQLRSSPLGAVAGSPGTAPTGWVSVPLGLSNGVTRSIAGAGTDLETGLVYFDVSLVGTFTSSESVSYICGTDTNSTAASVGQAWSASMNWAVISGVLPAPSTAGINGVRIRYGSPSLLAQTGSSDTPNTVFATRQTNNNRIAPASTTVVGSDWLWSFSAGQAINCTIRFGAYQLETGSTATAYIPTTTAAVTVVLPRITNRGILVEEARTNSLPQSEVTGVVAGTPGTNPTGWQVFTNANGLTKTIVGSGTEGGRTYVDIRLSGTPINFNGNEIIPQATTGVAALNGQVWTGSFFVSLVGGTLTNLVPSVNIQEISAASATLATTIGTTLTPTATAVRSSTTRTNNNALTAHERLVFSVGIAATGVAVDATFRLSLPQLELGAFATSPIITTGAAGTRGADVINVGSAVLPPEGTVLASYVVPATAAGNAARTYVWITQETGNNRFALRAGDPPGSAGDGTRPAFIVGDGSALSQMNGTSLTSNTIAKTAASYSTLSAMAGVAFNGVDQTAVRQLYAAATSQTFFLGQSNSAGALLNSYLVRLQIIPRFLSAAERIALTAP